MIKNDKVVLNMFLSYEDKFLYLVVLFIKLNDVCFIFGIILLFKSLKLDDVIFFVVLCIGIVVIVWMVFCFLCGFESVYVEVFWMKINVLIGDVIKKLF